MGRPFFVPQHLFPQLLPLLSLLCLHHPFRTLLGTFHFLVSLLILSYSDFPILLQTGLSPLHPVLYLYQVLYLLLTPYIDLYLSILLPGPLAFPWCAFLPCLYLIMAAVLRKGPLAAGPGIGSGAGLETIPIMPPGGNVPGLPLLVAPFLLGQPL